MKLTTFPQTIFSLALLLAWGHCAPPATAQSQGSHPLYQDIYIPAPPQTVEVHRPRDSYNAIFQSEVRVFPNGAANGFLRLDPTDSVPARDDEVLVVFENGSVRFKRDGTVAGVLLRGREVESGRLLVVMITPDASEDCLIYTIAGSGVQATWEAQGRIVVNR